VDLLQASVLGLVQGATEYLPVSSSGHLVLVPELLEWEKSPFVFDVLVQQGTLLGVIIYFWKDLVDVAKAMLKGLAEKKPMADVNARLGWFVGLATIPAGVLGLAFDDWFEAVFKNPRWSAIFLFLTALLLVLAERFGKRTREEISVVDSVVIGFAQALALLPGVSRSGSTISAGMLLSLDRTSAARFSFLMSIPVMVGAGVIAGKRLLEAPELIAQHGAGIALGFFVSALSGYAVIKWFLGYVKSRSLYGFAAYCVVFACLSLFVMYQRGVEVV
jgi:undecaprenyl-diphosphatase